MVKPHTIQKHNYCISRLGGCPHCGNGSRIVHKSELDEDGCLVKVKV